MSVLMLRRDHNGLLVELEGRGQVACLAGLLRFFQQ